MVKTLKDTKAKSILAIDPGDRNTGWAYYELSKAGEGWDFGTFVTEKKWNAWDRINYLRKELWFKFSTQLDRNDTVVIEDGYRRSALIKLVGVLVGTFGRLCNVIIASPSSWPRDMWGKGNSGKYKEAAKKLCAKLELEPKTQHEMDSISLNEWYRRCYEKKTKEEKI